MRRIFPKSNRESVDFLFLLIAADIFFFVLHLFHMFSPIFQDTGFSIAKERGFGEVFQYIKGFWIVLMFAWLGLAKSRAYFMWSFIYGYLVVDDWFFIHERGGVFFPDYIQYPSVSLLQPKDFGELTAFAITGIVFLPLIGGAFLLGNGEFKRNGKTILRLLLLLAFFGIIMDVIHASLGTSVLAILVGLLEDGGEMIVLSVTCWFVLRLFRGASGFSSAETA